MYAEKKTANNQKINGTPRNQKNQKTKQSNSYQQHQLQLFHLLQSFLRSQIQMN